jgi:hypothetical protein
MTAFNKSFRMTFFSLVVLVGYWGLVNPAFGQLSLISSTPADERTNVGTLTTIELKFSAPLDTTADFDGFYLGIEIFPADSVGEAESVTISNDLTTVTAANVPLTENTKFVILLTGARSNTGAPLDRPYVITFTTANSLPPGSISGEVSFPSGNPSGAIVGLFEGGFFAGDPTAFAVTLSPYTVKFLANGTYFPIAVKDINGDGAIDLFGGDAFGIYDPNGDGIPDSVVVSGGNAVSGVNMTLFAPVAVTARDNFSNVEAAAQILAADAALVAVSAPAISPEDGTAVAWLYGFFSENTKQTLTLLKLAGIVIPIELEDGELPDSTALPGNWIDSNVAADSAEANGGNDFRTANPDAQVTAVLFNIPEIEGGALGKSASFATKVLWPRNAGFAKTGRLERVNKSVGSANPAAAWVFFYLSEATGEDFTIALDAQTGRPLRIPGPGPTAARTNLLAANQAASIWAADAVSVLVGNTTPDLTPTGTATAWTFAYYSATKDSARAFFLVSGLVVGQESAQIGDLPSKEALPEGWIDTPVASLVAEANSNNFRSLHSDAIVQALLSRGLLQNAPSRAVWRFTYVSQTDQAILTLHIDALTGALITAVKEESEFANAPTSYVLQQNYPNPFFSGVKSRSVGNPETVIEYQLPQSGEVDLAIFDLMGHKVRELVREIKPAGSYKARWDGRDDKGNRLTGGIYFYRLKSGEFVRTKRMILLQ